MSTLAKVRFDTSDTHLQNALRTRVDAYFDERGLSRHADARMVRKTVFFLALMTALWAVLAWGVLPALVAAPVCVVLGIVLAAVGFNVGHDAIHGAWSSKPWVNRLLSHSFDLAGASSWTWSTAHNFVHHTYTNIPEVDHDLEPGPFMLFYARAKPAWIYRFQHLYSFPLYAFTTIIWVYKKDFIQAFSPDPRTGKRAPAKDIIAMVLWKVLHVALFIAVPALVGAYTAWQIALGYFLVHAGLGVTLAVVFQMAHCVEATAFPRPDANRKINMSWAEHQLRTTADFAPNSWFADFFCGGLNRQVEHHLFAKICHTHYPALSKIVQEVAAEHGVPYHEYPTFAAAFASHVRAMYRFGRPQVETSVTSSLDLVAPTRLAA